MTTTADTIDDVHDETAPLLGTGRDQVQTGSSRSRKLNVMLAATTLILAVDFGFYLTTAPQTRGDLLMSTLGILLSVPFGVLADHWGRKPVLLLGVLGVLLGETWVRVLCLFPTVFPLRLVWLSGMWRLIGGGDIGLSSTALVMVADRFPEDEIAVVLSEVLATPISAYLMTRDAWRPFMRGFGIILLGSLSAFLMPETLADAKSKISSTAAAPSEEEETQPHPAGKFIVSSPAVAVCLLGLFISSINRSSTSLLIQYTSKRFHWSIANSSLLISLRGTITLANFLLLMPALSVLLTRYSHLHGKLKDLRVAQASSVISALGLFVIATAASQAVLLLGIVLLSLGAAFNVSCRSFVTSLVRPDRVGTLYSSAASIQALGTMVSGPLFAYAFRWGLHLGPAWLGLPFLLASAVYLLGSVLLMRLRVPDRVHGE
ncbi:MFS general substrate transporter [Aspergillus ellipticus CBS 707.79]|uniref:MFS general substrate transporter n=1 Tax=Aspergillus ellipticus CBS 707.79 TaxID=1448320 RepID=A0A319CSI5_9EURO|nr:MFS general substrate transporter [Aspergillus ellipticus CBS 707.79]